MYLDTEETIQFCHTKNEPEQVDQSTADAEDAKRVKFPVLLGISSTQTSYNHVAVIWNGIVIDYESKYTFSVTEESLRQICDVITTFRRVSTGFGLFPPKEVRKQFNGVQKIDWGITEFYKRDENTIHGYFL